MATIKKALGDDPLFSTRANDEDQTLQDMEVDKSIDKGISDIVSTEKLEAVKKTISDMKHEVNLLEQMKRKKEDDYQRMTFIVRKDLLDKLRDYCYTERISQKEGLERALSSLLDNETDLVSHPERPKQTRRR